MTSTPADINPQNFPDLRTVNQMSLPDAAAFYTTLGWRVIPLEPEGKRPHIEVREGWPSRASNDLGTVREWWRRWPNANIGICPEHTNIVCLDLDNKDGRANGVEAFSGTHEIAGGPSAATPNRGIHRVFLREPWMRNMSPRGGGFDLLSSAKQFVVAPSVVVDEQGQQRRYRWTNSGAPAQMPAAVRARIDEIRERLKTTTYDPSQAPPPPAPGNPIHNKISHVVDTDDRSTGMFHMALSLLNEVPGIQHADLVATIMAVPEYNLALQERRGDDPRGQLDWLWRYAVYPAIQKHDDFFPDPDTFDPTSQAAQFVSPWETSEVSPFTDEDMISAAELVEQYPDSLSWVIPDWIPRRMVTTLFGKEGSGKTLFMQRLCTCLAGGHPALGRPAPNAENKLRPLKCAMMLAEDEPGIVTGRQLRICTELQIRIGDLGDRLLFHKRVAEMEPRLFGYDRDNNMSDTQFMTWLDSYLEANPDLDLLVADSITDFFDDNENDKSRVTRFMRRLNHVAAKHDIAIVLIGHPAKASESEYSGSHGWSTKSRSRLMMERLSDAKGSDVLLTQKKTNHSVGSIETILIWTPHGTLKDIITGEANNREEQQTKIIEYEIRDHILRAFKKDGSTFNMTPSTPTTYLPNFLADVEALGGRGVKEIAPIVRKVLASSEVLSMNTLMDGSEPGIPNLMRRSNGREIVRVWPTEHYRPEIVTNSDGRVTAVIFDYLHLGGGQKSFSAPNGHGVSDLDIERAKTEDGSFGW